MGKPLLINIVEKNGGRIEKRTVESMHWLLDVHFTEDKTRVWDMNVQKILNTARKIALTCPPLCTIHSGGVFIGAQFFRTTIAPVSLLAAY